jgi:hypothetical protein
MFVLCEIVCDLLGIKSSMVMIKLKKFKGPIIWLTGLIVRTQRQKTDPNLVFSVIARNSDDKKLQYAFFKKYFFADYEIHQFL